MTVEIRTIRDDDVEAVRRILDGAYGPNPERVNRIRRYRAIGADTWLLAVDGGEAVGMAGAVDYGAFAYVGMVGVLPAAQRRGIGERMMRVLMEVLERRRCPTLLLDASEVGEPLYRKLGFEVDDTVVLYAREVALADTARGDVRPMRDGNLEAVVALDREVGRADRRALLANLLAEFPDRAFVACGPDGALRGFVFGQTLTIGPWIAEDDRAAAPLLDAALGLAYTSGVSVAAPGSNAAAAALLEAAGFARGRVLSHMRLGPPVPRDRRRIFGQASLAAG